MRYFTSTGEGESPFWAISRIVEIYIIHVTRSKPPLLQ